MHASIPERPRLVCPRCRRQEGERWLAFHVDEVDLRCQGCGVSYPRLAHPTGADIPVLLPDPYGHDDALWAAAAILEALADPQALEELLRDPRAHQPLEVLLSYAPAHMGAHAHPPVAAPSLTWLQPWLGSLTELPRGPVLLLGAAACGEVLALPFEDRQVVALDANPAPLAWAAAIAAGLDLLPLRRSASQLEVRPLPLPQAQRQALGRATLLCADALDPPFEAESFAVIVCMNLADSVPAPDLLLGQCEALLRPSGALLVASPWAWRDDITPPDRRLDNGFDPKRDHGEQMACLLTGALVPGFLSQMRLQRRADGIAWPLRVHDRFTALYALEAFLLRKLP